MLSGNSIRVVLSFSCHWFLKPFRESDKMAARNQLIYYRDGLLLLNLINCFKKLQASCRYGTGCIHKIPKFSNIRINHINDHQACFIFSFILINRHIPFNFIVIVYTYKEYHILFIKISWIKYIGTVLYLLFF